MTVIPAKIRNVIKAVLFTLILLFILCRLSYVLRPYEGSASRGNLCGFYAEKEDTLDVVFVGSSSCFAFWEPMEFWNAYGVTSYNFAAGTLPPQFIRYAVAEVLKTQTPELLVIDLRPFTVAETGYYLDKETANMDHDVPIRNIVDNVKYSWNRVKMIMEGVPDSYDKIPYYFDLIKYHTEWTRLWDGQSLAYGTNESHDIHKGFKMVDNHRAVEFHDWSKETGRKELSDRLDEILRDLLDYCQEEELQALFLVNAYCQSRSDKQTYNYISDVIAGYGFPYLNTNDYYQEIGLDYSTDYYDKSHTNIFGADKYTDFVGEYLISRYSFEDKREDGAYASWNEDYEVWREESDALKESILGKIRAAQEEAQG